MKKLVIGFVISIIMVGCAQTQTQKSVKADDSRFIITSETYKDSIYYITIKDKQTGVEYLTISTNRTDGGVSVTPLYNADGTLKTD